MAQAKVDWRELKKELFIPNKVSDTYKSQDIFNTKSNPNQNLKTPSKTKLNTSGLA